MQITSFAVIGLGIVLSWLAGAETQPAFDRKSQYAKRELMAPYAHAAKFATVFAISVEAAPEQHIPDGYPQLAA